MNKIKKVYCRCFQFCFHLALPFLPYRQPHCYSSVKDIKIILKKENIKSVLLVTDHFLRKNGYSAEIERTIIASGIHCAVYDGTCPNPTTANVEEALAVYQSEKCEALIAFGGGSSIDCAKAVGARVKYPNKPLSKLKGLLKVLRKIPTLIAIPTTAGTGSEVTVTAVITDSETRHKYTMNNFTFIPRYAILDPSVTFTLPQSLTSTTGMDALTHAVEAYIGGSTSKETRRLSLEAVTLIFENIEKAYHNGNDENARKNMLTAAYKAGVAFSKSYVGYIHAVAHTLGGEYNVPHGLANAVLMPIVLQDYGAAVHKKLHRLAIAAGVSTEQDTDHEAAERFIAAIQKLNSNMGIPEKLSGIKKEDIPKMAKHADEEANPLYPVPKLMNAKALEIFYYKVADWSEKT